MRSLILLTLPIAIAWNLGTSDSRVRPGSRRASDVWDGRSGRCAGAGACAAPDAAVPLAAVTGGARGVVWSHGTSVVHVAGRDRLECAFTGLGAQRHDSRPKRAAYLAAPYTLRLAAVTRCDATIDASMLRRSPDDSEHVVWRAPLVNNPKWAWVDPARGWIATMGNECRYDLEHALVIYDQAGRVVRDLAVRHVLTLDETRRIGFEEFVEAPRTLDEHERTGNDLWRSGGEVVFTPDTVWLTHPQIERRVLLARR
jgi:hypothetical protein